VGKQRENVDTVFDNVQPTEPVVGQKPNGPEAIYQLELIFDGKTKIYNNDSSSMSTVKLVNYIEKDFSIKHSDLTLICRGRHLQDNDTINLPTIVFGHVKGLGGGKRKSSNTTPLSPRYADSTCDACGCTLEK
jgi:hypothetical protein